MSQITIRNLPSPLEERLRSRAARARVSLNKTVIQLLAKATGMRSETGPKRDLSALAGRWTVEEGVEFDRAMEPFEAIDEDLWR